MTLLSMFTSILASDKPEPRKPRQKFSLIRMCDEGLWFCRDCEKIITPEGEPGEPWKPLHCPHCNSGHLQWVPPIEQSTSTTQQTRT